MIMEQELDQLLEQAPQQEQLRKPLLKRVHCNYLPVSDSKRASLWFEKTFGLKRLDREPAGSIMVLGTGQWLFLLETKEKKTANFFTDQWEGGHYEMFSMSFEVENIVELHKRLREDGVEVEPLVDHDSCGLQFKFKDPDGNKFNVWQDVV
jgi:predicted enzyme related to lactoylglutathione lyase